MLIATMLRPLQWMGPRDDVLVDAERLIQRWGIDAYNVADQISAREDMGLLEAASPGHWARVRREVSQLLGRSVSEPRADFTPN